MADPWENILNWLRADAGIPHGQPSVGQTTGGRHAARSYHYRRTAMDSGHSDTDPGRVARALEPHALGPRPVIAELFYAGTNTFISHGRRITPSRSLRSAHVNHCHEALYEGRWLPHAVRPPANLPPPPRPYTGPNLKPGMGRRPGATRNHVRNFQYALLCVSGAPTSVDGVYGLRTAAAVMSFQKFLGIAPTGGAGPKTIGALNWCIAQRFG